MNWEQFQLWHNYLLNTEYKDNIIDTAISEFSRVITDHKNGFSNFDQNKEDLTKKEWDSYGKINSILNKIKSKFKVNLDLPRQRCEKSQIFKRKIDIQKGMMCEDTVVLKVGSHVMCVVNLTDEGLCNGSQGVVTRFATTTGLPVVRFNHTNRECLMDYHTWVSENIEGIGVAQIPLINAWALTIHKSQGTTLDVAEIDIGRGVFECGQTYVALSRIKSLEGLYLTSFDVRKITINKKVQQFYCQLLERQPLRKVVPNVHRDGETQLLEKVESKIYRDGETDYS